MNRRLCRALLGSYGQTPLPSATPMRTARTPAMGYDPIMQQAENLARMSSLSTPLVGGDNPELHPSDFSGVTPRTQVLLTTLMLLLMIVMMTTVMATSMTVMLMMMTMMMIVVMMTVTVMINDINDGDDDGDVDDDGGGDGGGCMELHDVRDCRFCCVAFMTKPLRPLKPFRPPRALTVDLPGRLRRSPRPRTPLPRPSGPLLEGTRAPRLCPGRRPPRGEAAQSQGWRPLRAPSGQLPGAGWTRARLLRCSFLLPTTHRALSSPHCPLSPPVLVPEPFTAVSLSLTRGCNDFCFGIEQVRDELGLNDPHQSHDGSRRAMKAASHMARNELLAGLSQLPEPQNEYQVRSIRCFCAFCSLCCCSCLCVGGAAAV